MTCVKITFINKIASTYLQKKIPAKLNKYLLLQTPPALSSKLIFSKLDRIFTCVFPNMTIPLSNIGKKTNSCAPRLKEKLIYTFSLSRYNIIFKKASRAYIKMST